MIPRLPRALSTLAMTLAVLSAACEGGGGDATPGIAMTPRPGATSVAAGPGSVRAEPNVIAGQVTTENGQPIDGAALRIVGYTGGANLGTEIETVTSGADGIYRYPVPRGLYEVLGEAQVDFDGQTYQFDLEPADERCEQQLSDSGIVKHFVLRLTGLKSCVDGVDPENYLYYHGAPVQLSNATTLPLDAVIEYTLEPTTPLADGSTGQTLTLRRSVAALSTSAGPIEGTWILHDIPLAVYRVSAAVVTASGTETLLVATDGEPAASADLRFRARDLFGEPETGFQIPYLVVSDGAAAP